VQGVIDKSPALADACNQWVFSGHFALSTAWSVGKRQDFVSQEHNISECRLVRKFTLSRQEWISCQSSNLKRQEWLITCRPFLATMLAWNKASDHLVKWPLILGTLCVETSVNYSLWYPHCTADNTILRQVPTSHVVLSNNYSKIIRDQLHSRQTLRGVPSHVSTASTPS
jgi:hypothetical protein